MLLVLRLGMAALYDAMAAATSPLSDALAANGPLNGVTRPAMEMAVME